MGGLGGGGIPIPMGGGIGGIVLVVIIIVVMQFLVGRRRSRGRHRPAGRCARVLDPEDNMGQFVNAVTVDVQTFWEEEFRARNADYPETKTVLFTGQTQTGCGAASSATGPFYCPGPGLPRHVVLRRAERRFGAPATSPRVRDRP